MTDLHIVPFISTCETRVSSGQFFLRFSFDGTRPDRFRGPRSRKVKPPGREACHLPPSSAELKISGDIPPRLDMFSWYTAQEKVFFFFFKLQWSVTVFVLCAAGISESPELSKPAPEFPPPPPSLSKSRFNFWQSFRPHCGYWGRSSAWHKWVPGIFLRTKARPERKTDNLISIREPIV
jgi:hypothetical protein